jgi:fatty acid desaturase
MTTNEGIIDRALRVIVGLVLIAAALGLFGPAYTSVWGWIGLVPLLTGLVGWFPLYPHSGSGRGRPDRP